MQTFFNPVIATKERIIMWTVLGFEKEKYVVFFYYFLTYMGMTINGAWPFAQTLNPIPTVGSTWNLVEIGQVVSDQKLFNNTIVLYMYTA